MQYITTWKFKLKDPFSITRRFAHLEGTALLYSGTSLDSAQTSFICLFPEKKIALQASQKSWGILQNELEIVAKSALSIPTFFGYIGYEMGCFADPDQIISSFHTPNPDCLFYKPTVVIKFDHRTQWATLYSTSNSSVNLEGDTTILKEAPKISLVKASDTFESYSEKIALIKEAILEGEVYQVNLSQQFLFEGRANPFDLFEKSVQLNPAPFSVFLNCGEQIIVSSSPERFLRKKGELLETRPIKGTMERGRNTHEDALNRHLLLKSEKERAELLMITDLMRSDLGKVSLAGSIKTKAIWHCEAYTNVFHLLSIIESQAKPHLNPIELIRSLFPGGSVTGCPKYPAMNMISQLENRHRGIYTGSIGYFAENGDFDFNIAIRTLIVHPECMQMQLGGAIVMDSDPRHEFEETLHKGLSLFKLLKVEPDYGHSLL